MTDQYNDADRQRVAPDVNEDLAKELDAALCDVRVAATAGLGPHGSPNTMTMYKHAVFLALLARKADEQATKNLTMQSTVVAQTNRLYWLTIVLLVVAAVQIALAYLQLEQAKISNRYYEQIENAQRQKTQDDLKNKVKP